MVIISWNVNGIKACLRKELLEFMKKSSADAFCFQEIKLSQRDLESLFPLLALEGYETYWLTGVKNGPY